MKNFCLNNLKANKMEEFENDYEENDKKSRKNKYIRIYNPNDVPFGPLSNNEEYFMTIDGKRWPTVTNFILANMLLKPSNRNKLQNAKIYGDNKDTDIEVKINAIVENISKKRERNLSQEEYMKIRQMVQREVAMSKKDIYGLYDSFLGEEEFSLFKTAIEKAYNHLVYTHENLSALLLDTKNYPIFYISDDPFFGVGKDSNGYNLVGIALMQIRHNLVVHKNQYMQKMAEKDHIQLIVDTYIAYLILKKEIDGGNLLHEYDGMDPVSITNHYRQKTNTNYPYIDPNNEQDIYSMYKRGQLPVISEAIRSPQLQHGYLVILMQNTGLNDAIEAATAKINIIILEEIAKYYIKEEYPEMEKKLVDLAVKQFMSIETNFIDQNKVLADDAMFVYRKNYLPEKVTKKIKKKIEPFLAQIENSTSSSEKKKPKKKKGKKHDENDDSTRSALSSTKSSRSSSLSDYDHSTNTLLQILSTNDRKREDIIDILIKYEGKSRKDYKDISTPKLQRKMEKYFAGKTSANGNWEVIANIPGKETGRTVVSLGVFEDKPSEKQIQKLVKKYEVKSYQQPLTSSMVSLHWKSLTDTDSRQKIIKEKEKINEFLYTPPDGTVVRIYDKVDKKDPFYVFSMRNNKSINIQNIRFKNIYQYVYSYMITTLGVVKTTYADKKPKFMRGMPLESAAKLVKNDKKNDPMMVYKKWYLQTFEEMLKLLANRGISQKFEDPYFLNLLHLTRNAELLWADPHDIFLGCGSRQTPGKNVVGKILMNIREETKSYGRPLGHIQKTLKENMESSVLDIQNFIKQDKFLFKWIEMRISDMCSVVDRVKKYLNSFDIAVDMNADFVRQVIDLVYQQCKIIATESKQIEIPVPNEILVLVKGCKNMRLKFTRNYKEELDKIYEEMTNYENRFHNLREVEKNTTKISTFDEIKSKYEKLMENPNLTDEERAQLANEYDEELGLLIRLIELEQKGGKKEETIDEAYRRMWYKKLQQLAKSKSSSVDIAEQLYKYGESMEARRKDLRSGTKKSPEEVKDYEARLQNFRIRMVEIQKRAAEEYNTHQTNVQEIAQEYWGRIIVMILYLFTKVKTTQDVRQVLADVIQLLSEKAECSDIMFNAEDNCIASALVNILTGLIRFKKSYKIPSGLSEKDIQLAASIILDRNQTSKKKPKNMNKKVSENEEKKAKEEKEQNVEENAEEVVENVEENEEYEFEEEKDDDDSSVEMDEDGWRDDVFEDEDNEDSVEMDFATFGAGINNEKEAIMSVLRPFMRENSEDLGKMAMFFIAAVETIKNTKMPEKIKNNRINFFASIG